MSKAPFPLPVEHDGNGMIYAPPANEDDDEAIFICDCCEDAGIADLIGSDPSEAERADYIETAINHHDKMIEALTSIIEIADNAKNNPKKQTVALFDILEAARAAMPHDCQHSENEDCMICVECGECREDLDSNDLCMDCGGVDENKGE